MFCYIYYLLQWKFPKQTLKIFCDKTISFHGDINFLLGNFLQQNNQQISKKNCFLTK